MTPRRRAASSFGQPSTAPPPKEPAKPEATEPTPPQDGPAQAAPAPDPPAPKRRHGLTGRRKTADGAPAPEPAVIHDEATASTADPSPRASETGTGPAGTGTDEPRPVSSFGPPGLAALEAMRAASPSEDQGATVDTRPEVVSPPPPVWRGDGEVPPRRRRHISFEPETLAPPAPQPAEPAQAPSPPEPPAPEAVAAAAPVEPASELDPAMTAEAEEAAEEAAREEADDRQAPPAAREAEGWHPIVSTSWPPPPAETTAPDGTPAPFVPSKVEGPVAAEVKDAVKIYGYGDTAVYALAGITVAFGKGRFTAIMGPSGSGKSTLMHCLAGLDRLTEGKVIIGDTDLGTLGDKALTRLRRDKVGFIFQQYNLVPTLTALENITLPLDLAGTRPDKAWLGNVVDTLRIRDRLKHKPDELSGGQQQRVAVARALATKPAIIFADEPTGNLDTRSGAEVLHIMQDSVRDLGQTVVMVTHDPVAAGYADRAIFLVDGRVVAEMFDPTAERVLDEMKHLGD